MSAPDGKTSEVEQKMKVVEELNSPINGRIQVISFLGKPRILINNMLQSGGLIESIWKKAIKKVHRFIGKEVKSVLILGQNICIKNVFYQPTFYIYIFS